MIRPTKPRDVEAILALGKQSLGFSDTEVVQLRATLDAFCASTGKAGAFWVTDVDNNKDEEHVVAAAYCAPEAFTNAAWNLLFIAVQPDHQGKGRGTLLLQHVQGILSEERKGRLLLVETLAAMEKTREFYTNRGFNEEARIRDYYDDGEDKIVHRKKLA